MDDYPPTKQSGSVAVEDDIRPITPWSFIRAIESHKGLLTVEDLAALLRRSTCTVYRMAQRKQIPSLIIGGSRMFDPAALGLHYRKRSPESAAAARA